MSMLVPLYALGLLAVSLPVIFHLIRRMPRGEFQFSSLMFLSPSPPRLTRRSRLENILLLVLRAAVLSLLAFAFARPFLRQAVPAAENSADVERVAIVVDTSASMRRGDLWQQALAAVEKAVSECQPLDQIALFTCDDVLRPLVGFEELSQIPPAQRRSALSSRLQSTEPTWAGTALGRGLMDAVEIVTNVSEATQRGNRIGRRVVLVSDMQQGSRLAALSDYPWPEDVKLDLRPVRVAETTNAGLHRLAEREPAESQAVAGQLRVRVSNDADSAADQFRLEWLDSEDRRIGDAVTAYVPAGESRVVRVRRPKTGVPSRLRLSGDSFDFDNTLYFATRTEDERNVVYLGADRTDDPRAVRFYLERALVDGLSQPVEFIAVEGEQPLALESPAKTPLVVVTTEPAREQLQSLRAYAEAGGTLLFVLSGDKPTGAWAAIIDAPPPSITEAAVDNYTMLRQIAFDHPLFAPMAGPHFNDFTQIRFWKHRRLSAESLTGANVLARFENGDPALAEWHIGKGRMYLLTSGWQPADSQLARSWKFVLLVSALVEGSRTGRSDRVYFVVNEPVPLGERDQGSRELAITKPDGTKAMLPASATSFDSTDMPGVYSMATGDDVQTFAVNVDPLESRTAAVGAETLEQLGCRLVGPTAIAQNHEERQHLHDAQLESRQKFWQWLILAALGLVVAETWLAGRATKSPAPEGVPA
jgi:hypothetical protein